MSVIVRQRPDNADMFCPRSWPAVLLTLAACSPALNWREVRPDGSGLLLMLPCKPDIQMRKVRLAGQAASVTLSACSSAGATWALTMSDLGDPQRVSLALQELQQSAVANVGAAESRAQPHAVPGATPNPGSVRLAMSGRLPDGQAVQEQMAVFARGTWVFQATVVGERLPTEGVEIFFGSLRASP
jgi:hypothetical protein